MEVEVQKNSKQTIHIIITLVLMFGIGFIPPVSQLTVSGMKILGILLGMIYLFTGLAVPLGHGSNGNHWRSASRDHHCYGCWQ